MLRILAIIIFHVWYRMGKGTMVGRKEEGNLAELDCIAVCLSRDLDDLGFLRVDRYRMPPNASRQCVRV